MLIMLQLTKFFKESELTRWIKLIKSDSTGVQWARFNQFLIDKRGIELTLNQCDRLKRVIDNGTWKLALKLHRI